MTETQNQVTTAEPGADYAALVQNETALSLVRSGIELVRQGKITMADLFARVVDTDSLKSPEIDKKPPVPMKLTDAELDAIKRLPEVYGKVVVTADRKLAPAEQKAIVEERQIVDLLLKVLDKRKSESIREVLANHCDNVLDPEVAKDPKTRTDAKGHYAVKQDLPVEGTGMKIQRTVSGGKPSLTIENVQELFDTGQIDRKTFLSITRKPDLPRILDETGLHKAIQKNPALFFLLGWKAEATTPTTTIKVVPNS